MALNQVGSDGRRTANSTAKQWHVQQVSLIIQYPRFEASSLIMHSGLSSQILTASDEVEYKWKEERGTNVLKLNGQSDVTIATFQRARSHIFSADQPASLIVSLQGIQIEDEIVMTAIWFEEKRHQREQLEISLVAITA